MLNINKCMNSSCKEVIALSSVYCKTEHTFLQFIYFMIISFSFVCCVVIMNAEISNEII